MFGIRTLGPGIRRSREHTRPPERPKMLVCNRLRIEPRDGSPIVDYRIENGRVEHRTLETAAEHGTAIEMQWQRFTPEELTSHILGNTVVAHWLCHRLRAHSLIRAYSQPSSSVSDEGQECHPRNVVVGEFSPLLAR